MKISFLLLLLILNINLLLAQNTAPEVTNVTFSQRTDGSFMVDVYYDVNDADGDVMTISMQVSDDAGTTWGFSCQQITGDAGSDIASGTNKHIVWNFGAEHPQTFSNQIQINIVADDGYFDGTVTDIDGNVYQTIQIGDQIWMAENLKVTHYRNGDAISNVTDNTAWTNLTTGARCAYNNDSGNVATYGLLYNWYAVNDSRNIAPAGWHVPTDEEWKELEMYLGMSQSEADVQGWRGTDEGGKLKETGFSHWENPNTGATNESGFSALPSGYRSYGDGNFTDKGYDGSWWSINESSQTSAIYRSVGNNLSDIFRTTNNKLYGFSIRCIMD